MLTLLAFVPPSGIFVYIYIYIMHLIFIFLFIHFLKGWNDHLIVAPFDIVASLFWFFSSFLGMVQNIAI